MSEPGDDEPWDGDAPMAVALDRPTEARAARRPIDVIEGADPRGAALLGLEPLRPGLPLSAPDGPSLRVGDLRPGGLRSDLLQRGLREHPSPAPARPAPRDARSPEVGSGRWVMRGEVVEVLVTPPSPRAPADGGRPPNEFAAVDGLGASTGGFGRLAAGFGGSMGGLTPPRGALASPAGGLIDATAVVPTFTGPGPAVQVTEIASAVHEPPARGRRVEGTEPEVAAYGRAAAVEVHDLEAEAITGDLPSAAPTAEADDGLRARAGLVEAAPLEVFVPPFEDRHGASEPDAVETLAAESDGARAGVPVFGAPLGARLARALQPNPPARVARPRTATEARIHAQAMTPAAPRVLRELPVLRALVPRLRFGPTTSAPDELRAWIDAARAVEGLAPYGESMRPGGDARAQSLGGAGRVRPGVAAQGRERGEPSERSDLRDRGDPRARADALVRDMADSLLVGSDASGSQEFRLVLADEFFGGTELRIVRSLDGIVAVFTPPDRDTWRLLSSEGPRLRAELEQKGLRVSRIEVVEP
jgi:hypothetical protein